MLRRFPDRRPLPWQAFTETEGRLALEMQELLKKELKKKFDNVMGKM
jgi:hypothetical protein